MAQISFDFEDPAERLFGFKLANPRNLTDRLPDTSPLRALYADWEERMVLALLRRQQAFHAVLVGRLRQMFPDKAIKQDPGDVKREIANMTDFWSAWGAGYYAELLPFIDEAARIGLGQGGATLSTQFGIQTNPLSSYAHVKDWAQEHSAKLVKKKSRMFRRNLTQTDIRNIQSAVASWSETGLPFNELVTQLEGIVANPYRARMIAATESTRAYAQANRILWRDSGFVEGERWNTANDELVCFLCGGVSGKVKPIEEDYWQSSEGPLDMPAHVNCRCWPTPVVLSKMFADEFEGSDDIRIQD